MKFSRRVLLVGGLLGLGGCSTWEGLSLRSQSPEEPKAEDSGTRLVADLAVPFNMFPVSIENVGLVTGLKGTGSDPKPSPQRDRLLAEMQTRDVNNPNAVLASPDTSMVLVQAVIPPGIQKGEHFDVRVRVPNQSDTTSLRGGYLLQTHLKEMKSLGSNNAIHEGWTYGLAEGAVLIDDPCADPKKDRLAVTRGRILGGGIATKSRPLGLVLKPNEQSVFNAARTQDAINKRFHTFDKGIKSGVAKAKDDKYIELKLHPRYKDNIQRYVAVVRSLALKESESERSQRMGLLERQLLDPLSAPRAALQLEAIGKQASETLLRGIQSSDPEIRFYSAEALAYLDDTKAAEPLGEAARNQPAFRMYALTALSAMDDYAAAEQLRQLLHVPSAETRYGAFRALWAMNPNDPAIRGEQLGKQFSYHVLETTAPPMVHVTRSRRAELVLFGRDQRLLPPFSLEAGNRIMVTGRKADEVVLSKFAPNEPDQKRVVANRLDEIIRAIVELGGAYPDVVQALQQAKSAGALVSRYEVDAVPGAGRRYDRIAKAEGEKGEKANTDASEKAYPMSSSPTPDLYLKSDFHPDQEGETSAKSDKGDQKDSDSEEKPRPKKSFFAKMMGRSED